MIEVCVGIQGPEERQTALSGCGEARKDAAWAQSQVLARGRDGSDSSVGRAEPEHKQEAGSILVGQVLAAGPCCCE